VVVPLKCIAPDNPPIVFFTKAVVATEVSLEVASGVIEIGI
jgi:hypothetical protein